MDGTVENASDKKTTQNITSNCCANFKGDLLSVEEQQQYSIIVAKYGTSNKQTVLDTLIAD